MSYSKKHNALNAYSRTAAETEVAYASPHRLVQMLMEGALDKIATARGMLSRQDLAGKSRHISWALAIINGLRSSLDMDTGGEIAVNLNDLYAYMTRRLIDANAGNDGDALDEVSNLMSEIKSAWDAMPDDLKRSANPRADLLNDQQANP